MKWYYGCILSFAIETGYGSTNKDSTASLIFVVVNLMAIGIITNFFGLDVRDIPILVSLSAFLILFFATYKYFKKESVKSEIIRNIRGLSRNYRIILYCFCLFYTVLVPFIFLKVYA